jgi:hypothetical protein
MNDRRAGQALASYCASFGQEVVLEAHDIDPPKLEE